MKNLQRLIALQFLFCAITLGMSVYWHHRLNQVEKSIPEKEDIRVETINGCHYIMVIKDDDYFIAHSGNCQCGK